MQNPNIYIYTLRNEQRREDQKHENGRENETGETWYAEVATPKTKAEGKSARETSEGMSSPWVAAAAMVGRWSWKLAEEKQIRRRRWRRGRAEDEIFTALISA